MSDKKLYYYTDFETFKLILRFGTLRFKESTSSNDNLDTKQLYSNLADMAKQKLDGSELQTEQKFIFELQRYNGSKSTRISLVACFTSKADSRMLWDAYTMHRKDRAAERYNGVCIQINKAELLNAINRVSNYFDVRCCKEVIYGFDSINDHLEQMLEEYSSQVKRLSLDEDQTQNIISPIQIPLTRIVVELKKCIVLPTLALVDQFDSAAPFYKHSFWFKECETRALLSAKIQSKTAKELERGNDGGAYFDLPITPECIEKVILGPEFSDSDVAALKEVDGVIGFDMLKTEPSNGTGVITNR